jgi:PHD/YefM family antitoxin component YafN of YafNO toxin-antitoxin module
VKGDVVLVSASDWAAIEETLYLHALPGMAESILAAREEPLEDGIDLDDFDWDADV